MDVPRGLSVFVQGSFVRPRLVRVKVGIMHAANDGNMDQVVEERLQYHTSHCRWRFVCERRAACSFLRGLDEHSRWCGDSPLPRVRAHLQSDCLDC